MMTMWPKVNSCYKQRKRLLTLHNKEDNSVTTSLFMISSLDHVHVLNVGTDMSSELDQRIAGWVIY